MVTGMVVDDWGHITGVTTSDIPTDTKYELGYDDTKGIVLYEKHTMGADTIKGYFDLYQGNYISISYDTSSHRYILSADAAAITTDSAKWRSGSVTISSAGDSGTVAYANANTKVFAVQVFNSSGEEVIVDIRLTSEGIIITSDVTGTFTVKYLVK